MGLKELWNKLFGAKPAAETSAEAGRPEVPEVPTRPEVPAVPTRPEVPSMPNTEAANEEPQASAEENNQEPRV